jgi:hypothetical protein
LESALKQAKENRAELEKVLNYYNKSPRDSLKYKAACFLIENMVHHYHIKEEASVFIRHHLRKQKDYSGDILYEPDLNLYPDIENIDSYFLIRNIDHSFKVWQNQPWGKFIDFNRFCEEILPYSVANEPLSLWKENYYNYFQPFLDKKLTDDCPMAAAQIIYDAITSEEWRYIPNMQLNLQIEANTLLEYRFGNCAEYAQIATYAMRALGIPCGIDIILQHPGDNYLNHYWNYTKNKQGESKEFELFYYKPQSEKVQIGRKRAKVYRRKFAFQNNSYPSLYPSQTIPLLLDDVLIEDVSDYYFPDTAIEIKLNKEKLNNRILYLCVFNNKDWIPVCGTKVDGDTVRFEHIEKDIIYLPAFFENNTIIPAAHLTILCDNGSTKLFKPQPQTESICLKRKFPMSDNHYFCIERILGGKFQVADNSYFKNAKTLYTIHNVKDLQWYIISEDSLSDKGKYRYIRYFSPENGYCNIAEIIFEGEDKNILSGKVIGTDGYWPWGDSTHTKDKAFDRDPLTYFDAPINSEAWVGLDLGKPYKISKIAFLPRNDDNHIRGGDLYELCYWQDKWHSLGKQVGVDAEELSYNNVPKGSVLHLKNHTRGQQERIFTYEKGEQIWR